MDYNISQHIITMIIQEVRWSVKFGTLSEISGSGKPALDPKEPRPRLMIRFQRFIPCGTEVFLSTPWRFRKPNHFKDDHKKQIYDTCQVSYDHLVYVIIQRRDDHVVLWETDVTFNSYRSTTKLTSWPAISDWWLGQNSMAYRIGRAGAPLNPMV